MKSQSLRTTNLKEAKLLAKMAKLEELETLAKINAVTNDAIQRITLGRKLTLEAAMGLLESSATFQSLAETTKINRVSILGKFIDTLGGKSIQSVSSNHVHSFVNAPKTGLETRKARLKSIRHFVAVLRANGVLLHDPTADVRIDLSSIPFHLKEPKVRHPFTSDEIKAIPQIPEPWRTLVLFSMDTGARLADCATLTHQQVDLGGGRAVVWTDKFDKRIEMRLSPETCGALAPYTYWIQPEEDEVLQEPLWPELNDMAKNPKQRAALSVYAKRALKKAGIRGKTFHSARHTFATRLAHLGESVDAIRVRMGHVSQETTKGYIHEVVQ
jgi:integrase